LAQDKVNFPTFKGMAVGNGVLSWKLNTNTLVPLFYNHGLMRQTLWDTVAAKCCDGNPSTCDFESKMSTQPCRNLIITQLDSADALDPYNLYSACYLHPDSEKAFIRNRLMRMVGIKMEERSISKQSKVPICAQYNATQVYINRADVRTALNIPTFLPHWRDCKNLVYRSIYDDQVAQVNAILNAGVRVLLYNGDVDSVCNGIMNIQFIKLLGRTVLGSNVESNQPWYYADEEPNVAGYITKFSGGLDFLTIRGAGHFVPADKGREALQMIYNFINNRDYSLPTGLSTAPQPPAGRK